ncbi:NifU family protein [Streptomyces carminius]|uniref:NifU family protein n=1 Tax=Streptomyces carminius TaxID=2665496 RepID=A0A2M8M297_9ACTN|nr:NifU family protein [Streptomyces carminius]PJE98321.1 NifU family protein [Streptomyces carminius]
MLAAAPAPPTAPPADGILARVEVEPAAVVTHLGAGRSWSREGARIRTALDDPAGWTPAAASGPADGGAELSAAVRDAPDGQVGVFARSHGGTIGLVGVHGGVVTVGLGGACRGCPAAWFTPHRRPERGLRQRCPGPVEI